MNNKCGETIEKETDNKGTCFSVLGIGSEWGSRPIKKTRGGPKKFFFKEKNQRKKRKRERVRERDGGNQLLAFSYPFSLHFRSVCHLLEWIFFVHFVNLVSSFFFVFSSAEFGVVREVERNERSVLIEASSRRLFVG